jgi:hypothetical protein
MTTSKVLTPATGSRQKSGGFCIKRAHSTLTQVFASNTLPKSIKMLSSPQDVTDTPGLLVDSGSGSEVFLFVNLVSLRKSLLGLC